MFTVMLCGAHDLEDLSDAFNEVVRDFGGDPWFYKDGTIRYLNLATSTWEKNSRASVSNADICVFVLLEKFGEITWSTELEEALQGGTPFLILAHERTLNRIRTIQYSVPESELGALTPEDRRGVQIVRSLEVERNLTIVPYAFSSFENRLRRQFAQVFQYGVELIRNRSVRSSLIAGLKDDSPLSTIERESLLDIALDDLEENKLARKMALRRLASEEYRDYQFAIDVLSSAEQGVQRLAFELLSNIIPLPVSEDEIAEISEIARRADDIGVSRRLAKSVAAIDPLLLATTLETLDNLEAGARRISFEGIDSRWTQCLSAWGNVRMEAVLQLCRAANSTPWEDRLARRIDEINRRSNSGQGTDDASPDQDSSPGT